MVLIHAIAVALNAQAAVNPAWMQSTDGAATQPAALQSPPTPEVADSEGDPPEPVPDQADPLDDPTVPVPGTLEPDYSLINRDPSNWFGIPPEKELLNVIRDPMKVLDERYGLAISGAYTMLFQQSAGPGNRSGAAGDLDLYARWTPIGRGTVDTGSFYFASEYRHKIGSNTPAQLGSELGTLIPTTNGFNDRGWAVKDAYWVQRMFEDHFRFGLGRVDPENLVAATKLQSANTAFLNKAFSGNPAVAFPGSGMGAAAMVRPVDWFYVSGGATNAYGQTTRITIDDLVDEWRLFEFAEVGYVPQIEGMGEGRYRVALWHIDSRELTNQPSDSGISLIADQEVGENFQVFARYGYADASLTKVRQLLQGGGAWQGLFGSSSDLTGLAFSWAEPVEDARNEMVLETFHRMQLTGRTQFTLGVQLIMDPSNAPDVSAYGIFSVRLRITF